MTGVIQFENVHNQQDKGAANDEKRLKAWRGGGTGFILVGTKLSKRVSLLVTELYTGLELPGDRETLSQQFGTVNGNARSLLGSGYDIRYCFANCSTDSQRISFRLELVKRPTVNNDVQPCVVRVTLGGRNDGTNHTGKMTCMVEI